jgi:hypothetical protein
VTTPDQSQHEPGGPPPDSSAPAPQPAERAGAFALEYAHSDVTARRRTAECVLMAIVTCAVVLGSSFVSLTMNSVEGAIANPLIVIVLSTLVATKLWKNPNRRAVAAGIWIGIGIALLLDGLCWFVMFQSRFGG